MAPYKSRNFRRPGGSTWDIGGELNIKSTGRANVESGGAILTASGGYFGEGAAVAHTTALSVLNYGVWNTVSNASTGLHLKLPVAQPGAEVWFQSADATTGAFPIITSTAGLTILIGSSTEAGVFADANTAIQTSGNVIGFKAVATSHWLVISNVGASACSTYTTALGSTA
jgi:hypothetical protein